MIILGIDPGATGALALFEPSTGLIKNVWDMPSTQHTLTTKKKTKRVDILKLINIFDKIFNQYGTDVIVHLEKVQAFGKQSAPAAFNFGQAAMVPEVLTYTFGWELKKIPPQTWKRQYNLQASQKDDARLLVVKLFPELSELLRLKKYVDRADAILLACYKP